MPTEEFTGGNFTGTVKAPITSQTGDVPLPEDIEETIDGNPEDPSQSITIPVPPPKVSGDPFSEYSLEDFKAALNFSAANLDPNPFVAKESKRTPIDLSDITRYDPPWIQTEGLEPAIYDEFSYSVGTKSQFFTLRRVDFINQETEEIDESTPELSSDEEVDFVLSDETFDWGKAYIALEKVKSGYAKKSKNKGTQLTVPEHWSSNDSRFITSISAKDFLEGYSPEIERIPVTESPEDEDGIPTQWKFTLAPNQITFGKKGNINRDNPFGVNKQLVYYTSTSMRTLSLGECHLEGFSLRLSVEDKIRALERCMEIVRKPEGFLSPYVWEFLGIGKSYGYYIITSVTVNEKMRDDRGNATKATVAIELQEVPEYQIYNGRDLARAGDLVKPNFQADTCGTGEGSGDPGGTESNSNSRTNTSLEGGPAGTTWKGSVQFIKDKEDFVPNNYPDFGTRAIGYGSRILFDENGNQTTVTASTPNITEAEASTQLNRYVSFLILPQVKTLPGWDEMSAKQQSALVSFSFNLGANALTNAPGFETIQGALKDKRWNDVGEAMMKYVKASQGGKLVVVQGLVNRRREEQQLWNSGL